MDITYINNIISSSLWVILKSIVEFVIPVAFSLVLVLFAIHFAFPMED
jgi:uncharacterized membrane protein YcfT